MKAYTYVHLQEEIRREALVRDWGAFARFLQLAAAESGNILNYAGLSQETGISQPTVKSHYQLLEDMFVGFTVPAYSHSPRKNLLSTPKFFLFDLGVRHAAAGLEACLEIVKADPGPPLRAVGRYRTLETTTLPRPGHTLSSTHERWGGDRFHHSARRRPHSSRSQMDRASDPLRHPPSADLSR